MIDVQEVLEPGDRGHFDKITTSETFLASYTTSVVESRHIHRQGQVQASTTALAEAERGPDFCSIEMRYSAMTTKSDPHDEHSEREIENIAPIGAMAEGDRRFSIGAIRDRQTHLAGRSEMNRAEQLRIYVAQQTDTYATYVISFNSPEKRD